MKPPITSLPDPIRERIAMVRVLCIGFMIYVHVPDNAMSSFPRTGDVPLLSLAFQGFLTEGLGRASAALLSLVSGLLTAVALSRRPAASLYRRRFRSIIVPMVLWSTLTVALYALLSLVYPTFLTRGDESLPATLLFYVNAVLFVSEQPMGPTLHLGFLRDLFVCILLAPLLLAALRRLGIAVPIALGALYLLDAESVLVLRPLILFAFSIGLWLGVRGGRLDALDGYWPVWVTLSVVATLAVMLFGRGDALTSATALWFAEHGLDLRETALYPPSRLFGALAIWTLAAKLVGTTWNRRLLRLSSYVFVAFCSHFLVLTFLWEALVRPLVGSSGSVGYAVWFAVAPFVAMGAAIVIVESAARLVPPLGSLLTGGRVSAPSPLPDSLLAFPGLARRAPRSPTGRNTSVPIPSANPGGGREGPPPVAPVVALGPTSDTPERRPNAPERADAALEAVADDDR